MQNELTLSTELLKAVSLKNYKMEKVIRGKP